MQVGFWLFQNKYFILLCAEFDDERYHLRDTFPHAIQRDKNVIVKIEARFFSSGRRSRRYLKTYNPLNCFTEFVMAGMTVGCQLVYPAIEARQCSS